MTFKLGVAMVFAVNPCSIDTPPNKLVTCATTKSPGRPIIDLLASVSHVIWNMSCHVFVIAAPSVPKCWILKKSSTVKIRS